MSPKLSVIVPVYNVEKYLDKCITSILGQTYTNIELILLDDGSRDGSGAICDKHAAADHRIRVIHKPNSGVSRTRNIGLEMATGELVTFVDSDDYLAPDYFADMADALLASSSDLVMAGHTRIDADSTKEFSFIPKQFGIDQFPRLFSELKVQNSATVWGRIFRTEIICCNHMRFTEDMKLGEDAVFLLTYLQYCRSVCFVANCGYFYRIMPGSLSNSLHDFECEYLSYRTFKSTIEKVRRTLQLDAAAVAELNRSALIYHERSLNALFRLPSAERRRAFRSFDLSIYKTYKVPRTWKGRLLKAITLRRMTFLTGLLRSLLPN